MAPILPRKLCVACRGAFAALDAKLCVQCERLAEAKLEQLTLMIQDYERRYDRSFTIQNETDSKIRSAAFSVISWAHGSECNDCTPVGYYGAGGWDGDHEADCGYDASVKKLSALLDAGGASKEIELTEADFIDEVAEIDQTFEAIRNGVDDATDIPSASGFNKSR